MLQFTGGSNVVEVYSHIPIYVGST
jgi:hypothetical protein